MKKLGLYGAGDLGLWALELCNRKNASEHLYEEIFFIDDNPNTTAPQGMRCADFSTVIDEPFAHDIGIAVCIGEPRTRQIVADKVRKAGLCLETIIDPDARVSLGAHLEEGCIVGGFSSIGPNTFIGANTLMLDSVISHNCRVGESCVFDSRSTLSCHVSVQDQSFLSIGAMVKEGVSIGSCVIVDMGAAVFLDVEDGLFVAGNPAQPMRRNEDLRVFRS